MEARGVVGDAAEFEGASLPLLQEADVGVGKGFVSPWALLRGNLFFGGGGGGRCPACRENQAEHPGEAEFPGRVVLGVALPWGAAGRGRRTGTHKLRVHLRDRVAAREASRRTGGES